MQKYLNFSVTVSIGRGFFLFSFSLPRQSLYRKTNCCRGRQVGWCVMAGNWNRSDAVWLVTGLGIHQGSGGQSRSQKGAFGPRRASAAHAQQWDRGLSCSGRWRSGEVGGPVKRNRVSEEPRQQGKGAVLHRSKISKEFPVFLQNSWKSESELHGPSLWIYFFPSKCGTVSAISKKFHSWEGTGNCSMIFVSSRGK